MGLRVFNEDDNEWEAPTDNVEVAQDITITDSSKGLILTSATKSWRITIDDTGTLVITEITPV